MAFNRSPFPTSRSCGNGVGGEKEPAASNKQQSPVLYRSMSYRSDCGYSSGQEGCDNCSIPSSRDGSDIACSEGVCNHDGKTRTILLTPAPKA